MNNVFYVNSMGKRGLYRRNIRDSNIDSLMYTLHRIYDHVKFSSARFEVEHIRGGKFPRAEQLPRASTDMNWDSVGW